MAASVGTLIADLVLKTSGFTAGAKKANKQLAELERKFKRVDRSLKKVEQSFMKTGKSLTVGLTAPIALVGALAVKTFADFEQQMAKVQAISGASAKEFETLKKTAEDLGKSTRFTASQVAELELNLSKLGFTPEAINKATASILDLSLATGEDLAQSATVAATTLNAFQLTADETQRVVDVMALSFSSSALDLQKFQDAMKSVAPVANAVGASLEDTTGVLSVLTDNGLEASTAGTSLRNIFLELAKKGISWKDAMEKINNSTNKVTTAQDLFGKRAAAAALIIAENGTEIDKLTASYNTSEGAAKGMAKTMDATLQGSLLKVKSALEGAAIELGAVLAPIIDKVGKKIASLANMFSNLSTSTKKTIAVVALVVAAVGPALIIMGKLTAGIRGVIAVMKVLRLVAVTNPIGLLVAGIAIAVAALVAFSGALSGVSEETQKLREIQKSATTEALKQRAVAESLIKVAKDRTKTDEERKSALEKLNQVSAKHFGALKLEMGAVVGANKALKSYTRSIFANAAAKQAQEQVSKNMAEVFDLVQQKVALLNSTEGIFSKVLSATNANILSKAQGLELLDKKISTAKRKVEVFANVEKLMGEAVADTTDELIVQGGEMSGGAFGGGLDEATKKIKKLKATVKELVTKDLFGTLFPKENPATPFVDGIALKMKELPPAIEAPVKTLEDRFEELKEKMKAFTKEFTEGVIGGLAEGIGTLAAKGTAGIGDFVSGMLGMLGGFAQKFGKMLIVYGLGIEAFKTALKSLNPALAVIAGAGLIAIGAALKNVEIPGLAQGGIIPAGFPNDSFPAMLSSGEKVIPLGQQDSMGGGRVVFRIEGRELVGILAREEKNTRF